MPEASLLPIPLNISVIRYTDMKLLFSFRQNKRAVTLFGSTVQLIVKYKDQFDGPAVFVKPGTIYDALNGKVTIQIAKEDTILADPNGVTHWDYEIRRVDSGGQETVWWNGRLVVHPTLTSS